MSLFDEIKQGLNEAIGYERGYVKANTKTITIEPIEEFTAVEIKNIRKNTGLTQVLFAKYIGVSIKTVEAWESGKNHPSGAACRMLALTKKYPLLPKESGILA